MMLEGGGEERDLNWNDCRLISIVPRLFFLSLLVFVSTTCIFSASGYYLIHRNHRRNVDTK
jgi:hypothetical protein